VAIPDDVDVVWPLEVLASDLGVDTQGASLLEARSVSLEVGWADARESWRRACGRDACWSCGACCGRVEQLCALVGVSCGCGCIGVAGG